MDLLQPARVQMERIHQPGFVRLAARVGVGAASDGGTARARTTCFAGVAASHGAALDARVGASRDAGRAGVFGVVFAESAGAECHTSGLPGRRMPQEAVAQHHAL